MNLSVFFYLLTIIIFCLSGMTVPTVSRDGRNLSHGICHIAQQEAISMGLQFEQSKILPLKTDSSWSAALQMSFNPPASSLPFQTNTRHMGPVFPVWTDSASPAAVQSDKDVRFHSLCNPNSSDEEPEVTCCTAELELQLLRRTTEELHTSLSDYLTRWSSQVSKLRLSLREEIFRTLEQFRAELNRTLCDRQPTQSKHQHKSNCSEIAADLFPKFRLMIEQFIVGQGDLTLDISIPIDNLLMQLVIDFSCLSSSETGNNTLEAFNEEIRCHKYCQARLNLILDSLMSHTDPSLLSMQRHKRQAQSDRTARVARGYRSNINPPIPIKTSEMSSKSEGNMPNRPADVDQYRLLYNPKLLFTIRLNRIMMQALELGESLIDGLKDFNAAQGLCMQKLMRMHHCALCAGETLTRPCPELCMTIISSCLQPLSELHTPWKRFTETIILAANTFLDKPELSMMVQFRQLPGRLIGYFRHLLKTHKDWLQPQCAGTEKLLDILGEPTPASLEENSEAISQDAASLQSYRNLLQHLKFQMDQLGDLWSRASSTLCIESPHLVFSSKQSDQCWNGTARGRFYFDRCDFCDQPKTTSSTGTAGTPNGLVPPGRRQRTSHIPLKPDYAESEYDGLASSSLSGVPYMFSGPIWNSPLEQEKELATRRANEILVRASRDLQWSTDSFLGELQAYDSIQQRIGNSSPGTMLNPEHEAERGKQGSWSAGAPKLRADETGDSLGLLAYGSMLGWDVNNFDPIDQRSPTMRVEGHVVANKKAQTEAEKSMDQNMISMDEEVDAVANVDETPDASSGFQPAWSIYGWSQPNIIPRPNTPAPSEPATLTTPSIDTSMDGSGMVGNPGSLPSFMEYADYPHLSSFNSFLHPERTSSESNKKQVFGPIEDDEDFAPEQSVSPSSDQHPLTDGNRTQSGNRSHVSGAGQTRTNEDRNKEDKEDKYQPKDKINTATHSFTATLLAILGGVTAVIITYSYQAFW